MATWIAHLRLSDNMLNYGFDLQPQAFFVGSIAPDASLLQGDEWQPSKSVTHFRDENGRLQPEDFYDVYLRDKTYDANTYSFLIGYYTHLLADVEWIGNVWRPLKHDHPDIAQRMETDPDFAYEFKRYNYFGHDFLYLDANPNYPAWQMVKDFNTVTTSLDFLPDNLLMTWLNSDVKATYEDLTFLETIKTYDFPYLSQWDMQTWLDCTTGVLIEMLKGKRVPCPNYRPLWGAYIQPYA
ncbi:MAG: zinc dependent phospholipase C family protein [Phototrophicaceae bacterium]